VDNDSKGFVNILKDGSSLKSRCEIVLVYNGFYPWLNNCSSFAEALEEASFCSLLRLNHPCWIAGSKAASIVFDACEAVSDDDDGKKYTDSLLSFWVAAEKQGECSFFSSWVDFLLTYGASRIMSEEIVSNLSLEKDAMVILAFFPNFSSLNLFYSSLCSADSFSSDIKKISSSTIIEDSYFDYYVSSDC